MHDAGEFEGVPYLAMEFLVGETLADKFDREGALPPDEIADVMLPVLAAVSAAHQEGVVHRDLKPENIFLTHSHDGALLPKVLDFSISRVVDDRSGRVRTQVDVILGTPQYMSPEQARTDPAIDDRSAQYALGAVLYEAATGAMAFEDAPIFTLLDRISKGQFRPPRTVRPEVPAALEAVILCAMALDPRQRFRSLRSMGASLLPFANERTRAVWTATFGAQAASFRDATLLDEGSGPEGWRRPDATIVDSEFAGDTLSDATLPINSPAAASRAREPRDEAVTIALERRPSQRWVRSVAAIAAMLLVATVVVAVLAGR